MDDTPGSLDRRLAFLREIDKLKGVLRQSRLTFDAARRENDAEHSWHLALMAVVLIDHAAPVDGASPLDLVHVLRMVLVHDLVEIDAGDTFLYDDVGRASQVAREAAAADRLFGMLDEAMRAELRGAWEEFEARITPEARFARALDRAQPVLQNLYTDGISWREHGVRASDMRARNRPLIEEGAPALWACLERLLDEAVRRGVLAQ